MNSIDKGTLVISLDYELMWGLVDVASKDGYGKTNVLQVPEVINRMVGLFEKYNVHVTFATVGMIMHDNVEDLLADLPDKRPSYSDTKMSPYENGYINAISKEDEEMFFQPKIVQNIQSHKILEIGTHTYCHYYCWAEGQTTDQFEEDIKKAVDIAKSKGINIKSVVFPRNQVSEQHLEVCSRYGIKSYRGNALKYFDEPTSKLGVFKQRICRLLDAYLNIGGNTSIPYEKLETKSGMVNICASRMLRPYIPQLSCLEWLRLKRIKKEMVNAAKEGKLYHLWWHPHNFGANMENNFRFLEGVLESYKYCHSQYGMQSCTMDELRIQLTQ